VKKTKEANSNVPSAKGNGKGEVNVVLRLPPSREVCRARKGGCGVLKWVWPLSREAVRADGLLRLAPGRVATVVTGTVRLYRARGIGQVGA